MAVHAAALALMLALGCTDTASAQTNTFTLSASSLTFCGTTVSQIPSQAVTVTTSNGQSASFSVSSDVTWLDVSPSSAAAASLPITISLDQIQASMLAINTYTGHVTISATGFTPATITITLKLGSSACTGAPGTISSTPSSLTFTLAAGTTAGAKTVSIGNATNAPLTFTASSTQPWISVSSIPVTIDFNSAQQLGITVVTTTLTAGQIYVGSVLITPQASGVAAISIPITLNYGTAGLTALIANPPAVAFPIASGVPQGVTTLNITNNSSTNVNVQTASTVPWLSVAPTTAQFIVPGDSVNFTLTFTTAGLLNLNYNTVLQISDVSQNVGILNVPVTLCIGSTVCQASGTGGAAFISTPGSLIFTTPPGSFTPQTVMLALTTTNAGSAVASATSATPSWLTVNPASATVTGTTPTNFTVTLNPGNLPPGNQASSSITFTPISFNGIALTVPVTVNVAAVPTIMSSPSSVEFAYQTGASLPLPQSLLLTSDTPAQFQVTGTTSSGGGWLVVSPQNGSTAGATGAPTPISVQVNPISLPPGAYSGQIVIANVAAGTSQSIPVSLTVSALPIVSLSNSQTDFTYQFQAAALPTQQTVAVTSSGNPVNFAVQITPSSGGNWLVVSPLLGATPQNLSLSINPQVLAGLAPGKYQSMISLATTAAGNTPTYLVTLTVTNSTLLSATQTALVFNHQLFHGGSPVAQTFTVTSSGSPLPVTIATQTTSPTCAGFVTATPSSGSTPQVITVSVSSNAFGVSTTCTGNVSITSPTAGNSPLNVPVTLNVSDSVLLNASPSAINVTIQQGSNPPAQTIALTSTDPATQINLTVTEVTNQASGWLLVGPTSGGTPLNLNIGYKTNGLSVGTYTGNITITATSPTGVVDSPITIPVTLVVTSGNTASATPASLTFNQPQGGPAPANQSLVVASAQAGLTFSATATTQSGNNWLSIAGSAAGTTPGSLSIAANGPTLNQGSYTGTITILMPGAANSPLNIPVSLVIGPAQALAVSPATLNFTYQALAPTTPAPLTVQVTSNGNPVAYTTAVSTPSGTPAFLTATASGTTPGAVSVGLVQSVISTLNQGIYHGVVTVTSPVGSAAINVTLTVTAAGPPTIGAVVNAASSSAGPVSPGEIVSIYGTNIGPVVPAGLVITPSGMVATMISNTVVTFDSIPAPLTYVSSGQINAIVPYEINVGHATTSVVVSTNGSVSAALQVTLADTAPGVFSKDQTGNGQGAILNQDLSPNSQSNPAPKDSVIVIFATGEGLLMPQPATGSFTPNNGNFIVPTHKVAVTIGRIPSTVQFAGEAPTLVSGVLQVNAVVPANVGSGPQPIQLTVGNNSNSTQTLTAYIK